MNLSSLEHLFGKYLRFLRYGDRPRPLRDWLIVALVSLVLLLVCAGWSYLLFTRITSEEATGPTAVASSDTSSATIDTVLSVFSARAMERSHYLTDYHFVDPSR